MIYWTNKLPQTKLNWSYVCLEIKEFFRELKNCNVKRMMEEACDIYTVAMCAITTTTGIGIPLFWTWSAKEWIDRIEIWKSIFEKHGLPFKAEYIRYGGNYNKLWKVEKALELARRDVENTLNHLNKN